MPMPAMNMPGNSKKKKRGAPIVSSFFLIPPPPQFLLLLPLPPPPHHRHHHHPLSPVLSSALDFTVLLFTPLHSTLPYSIPISLFLQIDPCSQHIPPQ